MTEFSGQDPFITFSGEPASEQDLQVLERLAIDLAESQAPCRIRNYAYEADGFYFVFHHVVDTDPGSVNDIATLVISDGDGDDRVILSFDADNNACLPITMPRDDDETIDLVEVIQTFLEEDFMDQEEIAVAKYLHKVLTSDELLQGDAWVAPAHGHELVHVADIIRQKMIEKDVPTVNEYEYGLPVDKTHALLVKRHTLKGEFRHETDLCYLPLFIELTDLAGAEGRVITYQHLMDGYRSMEVLEGFSEDFDDDSNEEIESFKRELGLDTPQRAEVELITRILIDATIDDTTVVDIGLN